jgi:hypothetical protein
MIDETKKIKIQKLFAMAEMGTGNEAEVALKKARLLLQELGISREDAELFTADIPCGKRKQRYILHLHEICSIFCGVVSISGYKMLVFAGDELGVRVAKELFTYLKKEIIRKTSEKPYMKCKLKNDFMIGMVMGLYEKMKECGGWRDMQVIRQVLKEKHFSKTKQQKLVTRYVAADYYLNGKKTGKEINLSRQAGYSGASLFLEEALND